MGCQTSSAAAPLGPLESPGDWSPYLEIAPFWPPSSFHECIAMLRPCLTGGYDPALEPRQLHRQGLGEEAGRIMLDQQQELVTRLVAVRL